MSDVRERASPKSRSRRADCRKRRSCARLRMRCGSVPGCTEPEVRASLKPPGVPSGRRTEERELRAVGSLDKTTHPVLPYPDWRTLPDSSVFTQPGSSSDVDRDPINFAFASVSGPRGPSDAEPRHQPLRRPMLPGCPDQALIGQADTSEIAPTHSAITDRTRPPHSPSVRGMGRAPR